MTKYKMEGIQAAGAPQQQLQNPVACLEVMTGAMVPAGADTVVMYEQVELKNGEAILQTAQVQGRQNIHFKGMDAKAGDVLLRAPVKLSPKHVNTLASVGKYEVAVARLPKVAVISTGDELVDVHEEPELHQIRKSNVYALKSLLKEDGILGDLYHIQDEQEEILQTLKQLLATYDVLLLSGGVSKGKYDFIPDALQKLGVEKVFHGIKQRPGKPFWFGVKEDKRVFAFPGNPVSTYVSYLLYFRAWLGYSTGLPLPVIPVADAQGIMGLQDFWYHRLVTATWDGTAQKFQLESVENSGSGDLVSMNLANGLLSMPPATAPEATAFFTPFSAQYYQYV
ncbi:molybdopterin molybdotransferase MoeA [Pontibacter rugosus]